LATEKSYRDFEFSLRFKCEADGNSGVYFHTAFQAGTDAAGSPGRPPITRPSFAPLTGMTC
jgi:hypothetical protein